MDGEPKNGKEGEPKNGKESPNIPNPEVVDGRKQGPLNSCSWCLAFFGRLGTLLDTVAGYGGASRTPVAEGGGALWKARRSISPREKSGEKTQCGQCATRRQRP